MSELSKTLQMVWAIYAIVCALVMGLNLLIDRTTLWFPGVWLIYGCSMAIVTVVLQVVKVQCPNCGATIDKSDAYCRRCGKPNSPIR